MSSVSDHALHQRRRSDFAPHQPRVLATNAVANVAVDYRDERDISALAEASSYLADVIEDINLSGLPPYLNHCLLERPARVQIENSKTVRTQSSYTEEADPRYNIWYNSYSRNREESDTQSVIPSTTRLDCLKDIGSTEAPITAPFCVWFAKGGCSHGPLCRFQHRIPNCHDHFIDQDVFGRFREAAGSSSLFIWDLVFDRSICPADARDKLEAQLYRSFHVFGPIADVHILESCSAALLTFTYRAAAEFARVAMQGQPVGKSKAVGVKWTTKNPKEVRFARREFFQRIAAVVERGSVVAGE